jgi:hypothetical protein
MKVRFDGHQLRIPVYSFVDGEDLRKNDTSVQGHLFLRLVSDIAEMPLHWDSVIASAFDPTNHQAAGSITNGSSGSSGGGAGGGSGGAGGASYRHLNSAGVSPSPASVASFFIADFGPGFYVQQLSRHAIEEQFGKDHQMNVDVEIIDLSLSNEVQFLTPGLSRECKWTADEKLLRNSFHSLRRTGSREVISNMVSRFPVRQLLILIYANTDLSLPLCTCLFTSSPHLY